MAFSAIVRENDRNDDLRQEMVDRLKNLGLVRSGLVEEALRAVPRHLFVSHVDSRTAYNDQAVATRWRDGEAISSASAPSIVALMLELLDLRPGQRVLEIGAGTGYNAALMARIVGESGQIVTIDLDEEIVQGARTNLRAAGTPNVQVVCSDGALGWIAGAPYDRVILTASSGDLLPAWHEQLARGGRLVVPLRLLDFRSSLMEAPLLPDQFLLAFAWTGEHFESLALSPCVFMPLRGEFSSVIREEVSAGKVEGDLSAILPRGIEARDAFALLAEPTGDEATEVHLAFQELFGLRLWLALREASFCEIYVPGDGDRGVIPAYLRRDRTFATAIGLCEAGNCCLLKLEEEADGQPVDPKRPFRLLIRHFGTDHALPGRLREQVETWDRTGHPFVWSMDGFSARMSSARLLAFPQGQKMPVVQPYETLLPRTHTNFLFTSLAGVVESAKESADGQEKSESVQAKEHLALLKQGKERWNQWRKEHPEVQPRFINCDLSGMVLKELDLRSARFNGTNLARADLFGSDLSGADLRGANLSQVRAANVNLSGADLSGTDLRWIFLVKASLNGARLCGANLEEARVKNSSLVRADLSGANLNFAHLNRADLEGATLTGASLMGLDLRETYLPDLDTLGDLFFKYRQRARHLAESVSTEIQDLTGSRDFAVGQHPLLVLEEMTGTIHIQGWDQPVIRVTSAFELPSIRQEQDAVFIRGSEHDLSISVPHIPHGMLRLMQHGSSSITTAVTATDIHGNITIEESGRVEMRAVAGNVTLDAIAGDVVLNGINSWARLRQIMGNIQLRNATRVLIESSAGSVAAEHITEILHCGSIAGTCFMSECQEAEVSVGWVGGSARFEGKASAFDCRVDGNVELHCASWSGGVSRVVAGGNLSLYLPAIVDLALGITSGSAISGDARLLPSPPNGNFATLVYGTGQTRLDITASGGVRILSEAEA